MTENSNGPRDVRDEGSEATGGRRAVPEASRERAHNALPSGYKLHWYVIGSVIGQGGFGITYLALDTNLDHRVAIKEFLPVQLVARSKDSQVHPVTAGQYHAYAWGLNRFISEARTLAKFRHPNIVRVLSVFEANNTAYMVMEYERGRSLESALKVGDLASEAELRRLIMPLTDGLKMVHRGGFIHRDIKPDNIYLRANGTPVLLDFGSARRALGVATRTLTALVTPGYAPFEQYDTSLTGEKKQGPWSDIYALGATLYRAVIGHGPPDAMARVNAVMSGEDNFVPASRAASSRYSPAFLAAIDWALEFLPENRPQRIEDWQAALTGRQAPPSQPTGRTPVASAAREPSTEVTASGPAAGTEISPALVSSVNATVGAEDRIAPKAAAKKPPPREPAATKTAAPPAKKAPSRAQAPREEPSRGAGQAVRLVAVLGVIAALGAWYLVTPPPMTRSPSSAAVERETAPASPAETEADAPDMQAAAAPAQPDGERAEAEAARRAEVERERAEIAHLLREAAADLAADRLTSPAAGNAFDRYREVLARDPGNEKALKGMKDIFARYLVLAESAAEGQSFDLAGRYLDRAESVNPGAESIAAARAALDRRVEGFEREKVRREAEARLAAEDERRRMEEARRAAEAERRRMEAARRAADAERQRMEAMRLAELERQRLEEEAALRAKLEEDFQTAQEIAGLLEAAERDVAESRLTEPPGENALDRYRAVLALDAENAGARAGLARLAGHFVERAAQATADYRFDVAESRLERAVDIQPDAEGVAAARRELDAAKAAYDGTRPITTPPFRIAFLPVSGTHTCSGDDPRPAIEQAGRELLVGNADVDFVPVPADKEDYWAPAGISKEPRVERLYALGKQSKLDGALMYWFSAVGVQCIKTHVEAYLVDLQARRLYRESGAQPDLEEVTGELLDRFQDGRRALVTAR